jgi:hypothetical protein
MGNEAPHVWVIIGLILSTFNPLCKYFKIAQFIGDHKKKILIVYFIATKGSFFQLG